MDQKQWLLDYDCLQDLLFGLDTEIKRIEANGIVDSLHLKKQKELVSTIQNIIDNTAWEYDEEGERLRPAERVVISLIENSGEWWSDPYAVVPVTGRTLDKQRWSVVEKGSFRPVGEKMYTQKTHAYRRCRQLNAAARDAFEDKRGWFPTPALTKENEAEVNVTSKASV